LKVGLECFGEVFSLRRSWAARLKVGLRHRSRTTLIYFLRMQKCFIHWKLDWNASAKFFHFAEAEQRSWKLDCDTGVVQFSYNFSERRNALSVESWIAMLRRSFFTSPKLKCLGIIDSQVYTPHWESIPRKRYVQLLKRAWGRRGFDWVVFWYTLTLFLLYPTFLLTYTT